MYELELPPRIERKIDRLPADIRGRVLVVMHGLRADPRPQGVVKMRGYRRRYRVRVRHYRLIYDIDDHDNQIAIVDIDQRKDIYR